MKSELKFPVIFNFTEAYHKIRELFTISVLSLQFSIFMSLKYEHGVSLDESHEGYIKDSLRGGEIISFYTSKEGIGGIQLSCEIDQSGRILYKLSSLVKQGENSVQDVSWEEMHEEPLMAGDRKVWLSVEEFTKLLPEIAEVMKKGATVS